MTIDHNPTLSDLIRATADASSPCISIYLPTYRAGPETRQAASRMKNAVREARELCAAMSGSGGDADAVLEPAERLIDDEDFWQHQLDGLALLLAPGVSHLMRLPFTVEQQVFVADRHHFKPLLPLESELEFHVLVLSQHAVRLYHGTRFGLERIESDELPTDMEQELGVDDREPSLQFHGHRTANSSSVIYHGQGAGNPERDDPDLERYFRHVDAGVLKALPDRASPLLLACVDQYGAMYREVSDHPDVVEDVLPGNPDEGDLDRLHASAMKVLAPRLERDRQRELEQYRQRVGTGATSDQLAEVVLGAANGRVDRLFVDVTSCRWGRPSPDGAAAPSMHAERQPGDIDLIDHALTLTLEKGGRVHDSRGEMSLRDGVAATLRY